MARIAGTVLRSVRDDVYSVRLDDGRTLEIGASDKLKAAGLHVYPGDSVVVIGATRPQIIFVGRVSQTIDVSEGQSDTAGLRADLIRRGILSPAGEPTPNRPIDGPTLRVKDGGQ